ncbi:hypothetical protein [Pseudanabaena sp. PCC 6802]|uniref:hypothetical protein n=1 Tax=Pseudanabaena sp. PCC 6802 TaxID=118173 RepID=UPI000347927E|nr:hypothetical protein [Pseudanabaena sp. PCC 6802]
MPPTDRGTKFLQIELTAEIYDALMARAQLSGSSASELVQQSLCSYLGCGNDAPNQIETRLAELESAIMQRVQAQVEAQMQPMRSLLQNLQSHMKSQLEAIANLQANLKAEPANPAPIVESGVADTSAVSCDRKKAETASSSQIRQLQIGDLVQVRDPDSPHYMEHLRISAVGIIRATVQTDAGEQTFLKRDLRFVESNLASNLGSD